MWYPFHFQEICKLLKTLNLVNKLKTKIKTRTRIFLETTTSHLRECIFSHEEMHLQYFQPVTSCKTALRLGPTG